LQFQDYPKVEASFSLEFELEISQVVFHVLEGFLYGCLVLGLSFQFGVEIRDGLGLVFDFLFKVSSLQHRSSLSKQLPPGPVLESNPGSDVSLDDLDGNSLGGHSLVQLSAHVGSRSSLDSDQELSNSLLSHLGGLGEERLFVQK